MTSETCGTMTVGARQYTAVPFCEISAVWDKSKLSMVWIVKLADAVEPTFTVVQNYFAINTQT